MRILRLAAIAEAVTLLVLVCIAVPLKHVGGIAQATSIVGPIHGVAFIVFVLALRHALSAGVVEKRDSVRLLIGAMLPFGGIVNERWLARRAA